MEQNRILANVLGHEFSAEELAMISGGAGIVCNGCQTSTPLTSPDGYPGCKCDESCGGGRGQMRQ